MRNHHRLLGVAFVVLLLGALSLSVLTYAKAFTRVTWVTLHTDHVGAQLSEGADVKLRGVLVGEVRTVSADGRRATLTLALDPDQRTSIPSDVTARLLPKTLFGERYVELVPPPSPDTIPIWDGAVITQDRSASAIELERVLDNALPLLQSIKPDKLAAVLGALSYGLEGNGEQVGQDLERASTYLAALNEQMPAIADDIEQLAKVLDIYSAATPDLLVMLRDATLTMTTVSEQRTQLAEFLASTTGAADYTRYFLDRHDARLIQLGKVSRPVLQLLAVYAPELPCLTRGVVALQPRAEAAFETGRFHITLEATKDNGKYEKGRDEPVYGANDGPACRGLPNPAGPAPGHVVNDGYDYGAKRGSTPLPLVPLSSMAGAGGLVEMGYAGTATEAMTLRPLLAAATATPADEVPDVALLLWGPLLRGAVVNVT